MDGDQEFQRLLDRAESSLKKARERPHTTVVQREDDIIEWSSWARCLRWAGLTRCLRELGVRYDVHFTRFDVDKSWLTEHVTWTIVGERYKVRSFARTLLEALKQYNED